MWISIFGSASWLLCSLIYMCGTFYLFAIGTNNTYDENDFQGDLMDEEYGYEGGPTSIPTNIKVGTERTAPNFGGDNDDDDDNDDIVAEAPTPAPPGVKSVRKKQSDVTC